MNAKSITTTFRPMKQVLILVLLVLCTLQVNAQNVDIPDTNFKNKLLSNTSINTNSDDEIQVSEAEAYSGMIDVSYASISDLSGVEAFLNITKLRCNGNELTSLDVSSNTALTELQCYVNQLTSLDISNNTALTTFYCSNNQITSLDVSANTKLTSLIAVSNQLTTLDVSNNAALTSLGCSSNKLTYLDVSNQTVLRSLSCANNELTSLNVSANLELRSLYCYNNPLTTLTFGNNDDLGTLYCYETELTSMDLSQLNGLVLAEVNDNLLTSLKLNSEIKDLDCSSNQLTSLDLSQNLSLDYLTCSYNQLTTLDVSVNTALETLLCDNNQMTSLTLNPELTGLNCFDNQLSTLDVSGNADLSFLNCRNNPMGGLDISNNGELFTLDARNCQLNSLDVSQNPKLANLTCANNNLTEVDVSNNTALSYYNCEYNQLTNLDLRLNSALTTVYCNNNQLTHLDLRNDNNSAIRYMRAYQNELICIVVDDISDGRNGWQKDSETYYCSGLPASVVINSPHGSATNQSPFSVTVTFDDQVTGFELSDLTVTNGAMDNLQTTDHMIYTFDFTPLASGWVSFNMDADRVKNQAGDPNQQASEFMIIYETMPPTVAITSSEQDETKLSSIPVTITFSEEVQNFELADVLVSNGTVENLQTTDNQTFTMDLVSTLQGDTEVSLPEAVAEDLAGNYNLAAENFSIYYDAVPSVVITASESDVTNQSPILLTITFSEQVNGFELTDLTIVNGAIEILQTSDQKVYQMNLAASEAGLVSVGLAADQVTDQTGNGNIAAEQWAIVYDNVSPTALISSSTGTHTTQSPVPVSVAFDEQVAGFELADLTIANGVASELKNIDHKVYEFKITPVTDGLITVDLTSDQVVDHVGNPNTSATQFTIQYEMVLGWSETQEDQMVMYPNPVLQNCMVNISSPFISGETELEIILLDPEGKRLFVQKVSPSTSGVISIDMAEYPSGIYLLHLLGEEYKTTKRVIKK